MALYRASRLSMAAQSSRALRRTTRIPCDERVSFVQSFENADTKVTATADSSVAIFPHPDLPRVVCKYPPYTQNSKTQHGLTRGRFAFVEYEDRRDSEDAYHEMHNKRIGRDDLLKIEVRHLKYPLCHYRLTDCPVVGPHSSFCLLALRFWTRP